MAVALVPLAAAPAALANPTNHRQSHHHSSSQHRALAHRTRGVDPRRAAAARDRLLRAVRHDRHIVLAAGAGYPAGAALVRALQVRLAYAGYSPGAIDGRYGPRTQAAVRRFQAAVGLTIDGIAGPRTLGEVTARVPAVHPGAGLTTGGARVVRTLQRRLARAGYSPGPIDGIFGPRTERAVRRFQAASGVPISGTAGAVTLARLESATRRPSARPARRRHPTSLPPSRPHTSPVPRRTSHPSGVGRPAVQHPAGWELPAELAAAALLLLFAGWYLYRRRHREEAAPRGATSQRQGAAVRTAHPAPADNGSVAHEPAPPAAEAAEAAAPLAVEEEFDRAHRQSAARTAFNEGVRMEEQQDRDAAKAAYRRADEAGHPGAACNLGILLEHDGQLTDARAAYARADERGDADGAFNLGCLLAERGDVYGAQAAYERADERGHAAAATNLGVLLEARGLIPAARSAYERAARRGDPNGAANLGALLEELGETSDAQAAHQHAKQMQDGVQPGGSAATVRHPAPASPERGGDA